MWPIYLWATRLARESSGDSSGVKRLPFMDVVDPKLFGAHDTTQVVHFVPLSVTYPFDTFIVTLSTQPSYSNVLMEEGEVIETHNETGYNPEYEWPGTDNGPAAVGSGSSHDLTNYTVLTSCPTEPHVAEPGADALLTSASFRLLVRTSAILHKRKRVAVLDGFSEVQVGRDMAPPASETPRIRLKEMEVSKLHATIYWDKDRKEWCVVDMGSKHGTFVRSSSGPTPPAGSTDTSYARGTRLSSPRVASVPRRLRHADELSVASTTFVVHIHENHIPCVDCSPIGGDEIELFDHRRRGNQLESQKRKRDASIPSAVPPGGRDPRKAISMLKRNLLSQHDQSPINSQASNAYIDRSARRRALHPDTTPIPSRTMAPPSEATTNPTLLIPIPEPVSSSTTPLPSTNIGHRLLMKQGWQPGTALGNKSLEDSAEDTIALTEPLTVVGNTNRSGLGSSRAPLAADSGSTSMDWKEAGKMRRWAGMPP
ncbi:hypothetical protein QCA50_005903 [Cerrena zonata]|uniref:Angiogenic factor with G patch and FHA domains 1 n=1 Tax=Cerrena zonata TaxID=2478898 RepID=A0AAW0GB63_9APHY